MHLCRYLLNPYKYQIVYNKLSNKFVITHSDSDWAQDLESCKSVTGYVTLMAHRVIFWMSHQQKTVALFSTETEYMALFDCSHQLVWIRNLLNEVSFNVPTPHIYSNSLSSLFWRSNSI